MPNVTVNGADIYYAESGHGPCLILSPGGLQGALGSFQSVIGRLSQKYRVIAYDRRFGGQSRSPMVVQTWDNVCEDVIGLMEVLNVKQAYLGGGSFGASIALRCAACFPDRVLAIFASNIAGGVICDSNLAGRLFRSIDIALNQGMKAVIDAFDKADRFAPFSPERAQYDAAYRRELETMDVKEFAQVMRSTIYALFDGPYVCLGLTEEMLKKIRTPAMIMPGNNDVHPRRVAEQLHQLVPNSRWGEVPPHEEAPDEYVRRVIEFLSAVEAHSR